MPLAAFRLPVISKAVIMLGGEVQKTPRRFCALGVPDLIRANRAAFIGGMGEPHGQLKASAALVGGDWGAES
jgi:hypothetical protein